MKRLCGGGTVALETLAAVIGEESVTLEDVYEPYLLQLGFLNRTPRGKNGNRFGIYSSRTESARRHHAVTDADKYRKLKGIVCLQQINGKSYRLIDADGGERLEKWGDYTLIRPDPQIIWKGERKNPLWKKADGIYSRSRSGGGDWVRKNIPEEWVIPYGEMKFLLSPMGFKHTGLFPEQAANWDWFTPIIKASGRRIRLLNLFAYTGGASVAAAKAGAFVCHVDASKGMVARAKQNALLSGVPSDGIRYIVDDCLAFVEREIRRGNKYDAVIFDPPSFGKRSQGRALGH